MATQIRDILRRYQQSDRWNHRRFGRPVSYIDAKRAVEIVLFNYHKTTELNRALDRRYRSKQIRTRIMSVWVAGSSASGRWNSRSDIDVWLQVGGLSPSSCRGLESLLRNDFRKKGLTIVTQDGIKREVDVMVSDQPPNPEYRTIKIPVAYRHQLDYGELRLH